MKIISGDKEIHASGSVISYEAQPIEFTLGEGPNPIRSKFVFIHDENDKSARIELSVLEDNKLLVINLFNFNSPIGIGNITPISVGQLTNRKLYLNFNVYSLEKSKLVHYTWYLGENTLNG